MHHPVNCVYSVECVTPVECISLSSVSPCQMHNFQFITVTFISSVHNVKTITFRQYSSAQSTTVSSVMFCLSGQFLSSVSSSSSSVLSALAVPQFCQLWQFLSPVSSGSSPVLPVLVVHQFCQNWIYFYKIMLSELMSHTIYCVVTVSPVYFVCIR